jgi:glycosyltransferase involved in cell wall biosynthesis
MGKVARQSADINTMTHRGSPSNRRGANAEFASTRERVRIALIAPPWFQLPPRGYGGIEWMTFWLVEELVKRGHEVTLVASGENYSHARFLQTYQSPPTEALGGSVPEIVHAGMAGRLLDGLELDIVHDHSFAGPLLARARECPTVVTAHGPPHGELADYYREVGTSSSLVAISHCQRRQRPDLPWVATVHNGIPTEEYPFREAKEPFVLWLGRMSPEKAAHIAIDTARAAGRRLVLAGKCNEPAEKGYFDREVRPRLGPDVTWVGEADTRFKKRLLSEASCLLFPIQWAEPFGIVMVEALACGTPVVAFRRGSVPEVVEDGVTGYICDDTRNLSLALNKVDRISPHDCRRYAVRHFEASAMASAYETIYLGLVDNMKVIDKGLSIQREHRRAARVTVGQQPTP